MLLFPLVDLAIPSCAFAKREGEKKSRSFLQLLLPSTFDVYVLDLRFLEPYR